MPAGVSAPMARINSENVPIAIRRKCDEAIVNLHLLTAAGTYYIGQRRACQRRCGEARIRKIRNALRKGGLR